MDDAQNFSKSSKLAYNFATKPAARSNSINVTRSYSRNAFSSQFPSMSFASRFTPQSVSGNPVDSSGSMDPAADGNIAQRGPTACVARNATLGM